MDNVFSIVTMLKVFNNKMFSWKKSGSILKYLFLIKNTSQILSDYLGIILGRYFEAPL